MNSMEQRFEIPPGTQKPTRKRKQHRYLNAMVSYDVRDDFGGAGGIDSGKN